MAAIDRNSLKVVFEENDAAKTAGSKVYPDEINRMRDKHNALLEQSFIIEDLQQTTGTNTEKPMSQAAITKELDKKLDSDDIVQTVGGQNDTSTNKVPSQKAVTDAVVGKMIAATFNTYFEEI